MLALRSFGRESDDPGSKDEDRGERSGSVDFEQVLKEVVWRLVTEGSVSVWPVSL